jgi:glutamate-5-semialdehyde dehydrogenase
MTERNAVALCRRAKAASREMALVGSATKDKALCGMARALIKNSSAIIKANERDILFASRKGLSKAMVDRLVLTKARIKSMADSLLAIAALKDPVGETLQIIKRPNGLLIKKVRVPIGVILIIYESRPNVTSDCIGLCLKSGNAVMLRGGSEAINSNLSISDILRAEAAKAGLPKDSITMIKDTDRKIVAMLLKQSGLIDLVMPRGGEALIKEVSERSRIAVIKHYKGVCHTYVDKRADPGMAQEICFNAKVQRPGVCNAMEHMLVHKDIAARFLPAMIRRLRKAGVEIRGDKAVRKITEKHTPGVGFKVIPATEKDWYEEYLDLVLSVKVVRDIDEAIAHITKYGSAHSDAIVSEDRASCERFLREVDSACVYANASTRFTDGGEFGKGAEIGISTDKLHARGPMGLEELTSYKYLVYGKGQIRR